MWAPYALFGLAVAMIMIGGIRRGNRTHNKIIKGEVSDPRSQ
jgi:hypothetical protein